MIYVISELIAGRTWAPSEYYTSNAAACRAVKAWAEANGVHVSLSGNSAMSASGMTGVRIYPVEEGMA